MVHERRESSINNIPTLRPCGTTGTNPPILTAGLDNVDVDSVIVPISLCAWSENIGKLSASASAKCLNAYKCLSHPWPATTMSILNVVRAVGMHLL